MRQAGTELANLLTCVDLRAAHCNPAQSLFDGTCPALTLVRHACLDDIQGGLILAEVIRHVPIRVDGKQVGPAAEKGPG